MKQLYRTLAIVFLLAGPGFLGLGSFYLYQKDRKELSVYLEQILDQTERNIMRMQEIPAVDPVTAVLRNTPTEYGTTLFALEAVTGELLGISVNNRQELDIPGFSGEMKLGTHLASLGETAYLKINGVWNLITAREGQGVILAAFVRADRIFERLLLQGLLAMCSAVVFWGAMFLALRRLKQGYIRKSERMNKILNTIGSQIGVFEWTEGGDGKFFSGNLQHMLAVPDQEWEKIKEDPQAFREFLRKLEAGRDPEHLIFREGRYLKVEVYEMEQELIGLVFDKTEEKKENIRISSALTLAVEHAARDRLTGLLNREGFETRVEEFLKAPDPSGILLLLDLDNFKTINDTLGHPRGDQVLKDFSGALRKIFRRQDLVGRIGGDEFTVFIPNQLSREVLEKKLEEIRRISAGILQEYRKAYGFSVSMGAAFVQKRTESCKALYERADTALYIAKKLGKDQYYINRENIRCMRTTCAHCREQCPRREVLMLQTEKGET